MKKILLAVVCLLGVLINPVLAWRSSLYLENWLPPGPETSFYTDAFVQDFSYAGYKRGEEPIPAVTGPVFDVTAYGADASGVSNSTAAIQATIDAAAAAGGGVVYLPAGTYLVEPDGASYALRISASDIVLRGAGVGQTFILNTSYEMRAKSVILVAPVLVSSGAPVAFTADLEGPTRRIPVADAGAFAVGDIVRMEWEFTQAWIDEHGQGTWWSGSSGLAPAQYLREVMAVNVDEGWIAVDVPTRYTMRTRDHAHVFQRTGMLTSVGIEDFSIGNVQHPGTEFGENDYTVAGTAGYEVHASWLISLRDTHDSWVREVESYQAESNTSTCHMLSNGLSLVRSFRVTVRNATMRRAQYGGGGGNGYMFRVQHSNENLLEDCIADFSRHGYSITHAGTSGNVFRRSADLNTRRATGSSGSYTTSGSGSDHHMHFSHSNLIDDSSVHNSYWEAQHRIHYGTIGHALTSAHGVFWNMRGSGSYSTIVISEQGRYGYVIGTSGAQSGATNPTNGNTAPADILEGIGHGATLEPQSLSQDQFAKRMQGVLVDVGADFASATNAAVPISGSVYTYGSGPVSQLWSQVSGPSAMFADASLLETTVELLADGAYVLALTAWDGGTTNSATVTITVDSTVPEVDAGPDQTVYLDEGQAWTPASISTVAWYDASESNSLTLVGGKVSQWNDKSTNNRHALQGTDANRPVYVASNALMNHKPSIGASGVSGSIGLDTPSMSARNAYVVAYYADGQAATFSGYPTLFSGPGSLGEFRVMGNQNTADFIGTYNFNNAGTFKNGSTTSSLANVLPMPASVFTFKSSAARTQVYSLGYNKHTAGRTWHGGYSEIIFTDGTEDLETQQKIEGYLAHKWGVPLAEGHPHKAAPPGGSTATATLVGFASDPGGDPLTTQWTKVDGPSSVVTFADAAVTNTTATFTFEGIYTLRLTADDGLHQAYDEVVITVVTNTESSPSVTYHANGAISGDVPVDSNSPYEPDALVTVLGNTGSLVRTGYTFSGWNTVANGSGASYVGGNTFTIGVSTTLYAQWSPNTYTVTFDQRGGEGGTGSVAVTVGLPMPAASAPSRVGYAFGGYYTGANGGGTQYYNADMSSARNWDIAADTTLYARWTVRVGVASVDGIVGIRQESAPRELGYYTNDLTQTDLSGVTGSDLTKTRFCKVPVARFALPTLPEGHKLESVTIRYQIRESRDHAVAQFDAHVYLLDSDNPSGTGTNFYFHGASDLNPDVRFVGASVIPHSGDTNNVFNPPLEYLRTLDGPAFASFEGFYTGNVPQQANAYFRFNRSHASLDGLGGTALNRYYIGVDPSVLWLDITTVEARSADYESWLSEYFGDPNLDDSAMASNGVHTIRQTYIAGLNPTNVSARFVIKDLDVAADERVLQWAGVTGRLYNVYWSSNLLYGGGFELIGSNILGNAGAFTDAVHRVSPNSFYRISVQLEE